MKPYHEALKTILDKGSQRSDRTGVGTISYFGLQQRYDLRKGFPAITTKKLAWRPMVAELLWFLEGSTDERRLAEIQHGTRDPARNTIWRENADAQGVALGYRNDNQVKDLGPIYGHQWRNLVDSELKPADQIQDLINSLKKDPFSRRHIINAWNVRDLDRMALPPCHVMAQFYVSNDQELSCQLYQRSADMFLGVPFNIASYSLLTHILASLTGLRVGEFVHSLGDAHIYLNHVDQVNEMLSREERPLPELKMPEFSNLSDVLNSQVDDFQLVNYDPHPTIQAPMAV